MLPALTSMRHRLPFGELEAHQFERLCYWWVREEGYEHAAYLGEGGGEQGRDITAEKDGKRYVFQCKRVQSFSLADAKEEIEKVLGLPEEAHPDVLFFLVTARVSPKTRHAVAKLKLPFECRFLSDTEFDYEIFRHDRIVKHFFNLETDGGFSSRGAGRSILHWSAANPSFGGLPTNLLMRWGLQRGALLGVVTVPPGVSLVASLSSTETLLGAALERVEGASVRRRTWLAVAGPPRPFKNRRELYASVEIFDFGEAPALERQESLAGFVVTFPVSESRDEALEATAEWCAHVASLPGHSKAAICIGVTGPLRETRELAHRLAGVLQRDEEQQVELRISSLDLAELPPATEQQDDSWRFGADQLQLQLQAVLREVMVLPGDEPNKLEWTDLAGFVRALGSNGGDADSAGRLLERVLETAPGVAGPLVSEMARSGNRYTRRASFVYAVRHDRLMDAWLEGVAERLDRLPASTELIRAGKGPSPRAALTCGLVRRWRTRQTRELEQALRELTRNAQPELQRAVAAVMKGEALNPEFYDRDPGSEVLELVSRCWPQLAPPVDELSPATLRRLSLRRFVESLRVTKPLLVRLLRLPPVARTAFGLVPSDPTSSEGAGAEHPGQNG